MRKRTTKSSDNRHSTEGVVVQSLIIGALFFATTTLVASWIDGMVAGTVPKLEARVRGGVSLFFLWIVITSTLRSINKLRRGVDGGLLLITGVGVAVLGLLLGAGLHWIVNQFDAGFEPLSAGGRNLLFYAALGLVVSIISLINLRVQNKMLGDVLELLVIGALVFAFFYFMK